MAAAALTRKDFDVFAIEGFAPRMEAIKGSLRPKLVAIAERLAPRVSELADREMFVHVARHARRTVNPPPETWAAFAHQARGYKKLPHFALCVSKGGALARLVLKDEATEARARLAKALPKKAKALGPVLVKAGVRDFAGWDAVHLPDAPDAKGAWIAEMLRHASLKTGVFDAGIALGTKVDDDAVLHAFRALLPVYSLAVTKNNRRA